jgi:hypothetical protein
MRIDDNIRKRQFGLQKILPYLQQQYAKFKNSNLEGLEILKNAIENRTLSGANLKKIKHIIEQNPKDNVFGDKFYNWIETELSSDRKAGAANKQIKRDLGFTKTHRRNNYKPAKTTIPIPTLGNKGYDKGVRYIGESKTILITESMCNQLLAEAKMNLLIKESDIKQSKFDFLNQKNDGFLIG